MKFVVYALILANLAMFGWLYQHQNTYRDLPAALPQLPTSVEPLMLLRERDKAIPPVAATEVQAPAESSRQTAPRVSVPVPAADQGSGTAPSMPEPAVPSPPASAVTTPAAENHVARQCHTVGPFAAREAADAFIAEVTGWQLTATVRSAHIEQPSGYWVYLPSMSGAEAQDIVHDLETKGVKDYFLGRQNFISLGVFTDKNSAESRSRAIAALGYTPKLEPRFLGREMYWVDLEEPGGKTVSAGQWDELLARQAGIRRQPLTCE